jgi:hypothetical protein
MYFQNKFRIFSKFVLGDDEKPKEKEEQSFYPTTHTHTADWCMDEVLRQGQAGNLSELLIEFNNILFLTYSIIILYQLMPTSA